MPKDDVYQYLAKNPSNEQPLVESGEIQRVREALRKSEARYHAILDSIDDAFCIIEVLFTDGQPVGCRFLEANRAFTSYLGRHDAEANMRALAPAHEARGFDTYGRVALTGEPERFMNQVKDGDGKWYDVHAFRVGQPEERKVGVLFSDITERKRAEQALAKRLVALTQPLDDGATIRIEDLFNMDELQNIQDQFAKAFHVASVITQPDGAPLTRPSNFTRLCAEVIRNTEKGRANCYKSDAALGRFHPDGPIVAACLSCGLWDAGASISVGGRHVASWLIGQVRDNTQTEEAMRAYAREIGADEGQFIEAFRNVPAMRREDFDRVANLLFTLAKKLSDMAYQNMQQARFITERKQAEEAVRKSEHRYRSLFQSMEAFALLEPIPDKEGKPVDFRYLEVNEAGARLRGVAPDAIVGRTILEVLPRIDPFWIKAYRQVLLTEQPLQFERWNQDNERWYRTYAYCPEKGKVASLIIDVTSRKKAEQELKELTRTLEQKVAERTQTAETRAKQLQALAVELIEAEEQERRRLAELLHEDLQQILASARMQLQAASAGSPPNSILKSVERLLEESITQSRSLSHELSPPVLHQPALSAALQWLVRQSNERFGLHVELETAFEQYSVDTLIKTFMFRAVQELLFNVVKHAGVKKARVVLTRSDSTIIVSVSDQGRGFNPDIIDSGVVKGGLGLRSLRERASHIGGSLKIESAPGQGSRFTLKVPAIMEKALPQISLTAVEANRAIPTRTAAITADELVIRILFADDHKVMRQGLIQLVAGKPNIQVVGEASNGREALELTRQIRPDVVVMDVSMPEMDGIEATRRIKTEMPEMRVIGLSMLEDEHTSKLMRNAGAEAFVSKAASSSELLKSIYGFKRQPAA